MSRATPTCLLSLPNGEYLIVDEADRGSVEGYTWRLSSGGYVRRAGSKSGHWLYLHRLLCPVAPPLVVDHINGDKLDNRRSNLRPATQAQNMRNADYRGRGPTPFRGVCSNPRGWQAKIRADGKQRSLGVFATPEQAARAYDAAALLHHGQFARLNFPEAA